MREKLKAWLNENKKFIFLLTFLLVACPLILSFLVYNQNVLSCIPGDTNVWMGFWASYSGTIVTVCVAIISWKGNKKIEKLDATLREEQRQYFLSMIGTNLRLNNTYIKAISQLDIAEYAKKVGTKKVGYKIIMEFENVSNRVIANIRVKGIGIELDKKLIQIDKGDIEASFRLQGNTPIVEILLWMNTGYPIERKFTQFYFYYSQFPIEGNQMKLTMSMDVELQKSRILHEKEDEKVTNMQLDMNLKMEPILEKKYGSNKVNIINYNLVENTK